MHTDFVIEQPRHLSDALEILGADDPMVRPLAGGTGLVVLLKFDVMPVTTLVDLGRVAPELSGISVTEAGGARLGAMATLGRLQRSRELLTAYPILEQVLQVLASNRIRNVAQLGGALAHAHPQMDLPPVLVALGARVRARSRNGERWIDIDDLIVGYYETCLRSDELIVEVELPPPGRHRGIYRKVTERTADDWPMLGVAAVASPGDPGRNSVWRWAGSAIGRCVCTGWRPPSPPALSTPTPSGTWWRMWPTIWITKTGPMPPRPTNASWLRFT